MSEKWLLQSRIRPTPDKRRTVQRQHLMKKALAGLDGGVLLIDAPPGFGKTALLANLSKRLQEQSCTTAWFTLDPTDDPWTALRYLFFAVGEAGGDLDAQAVDLSPALAVQSLLSRIERSGRRWMLVLDNVGAAQPAVVTTVLSPLLRFMPDRLTIALATEGAVPLPLSELDRRGLLRRLDADDLLFDRAEIKALAGRAATDHQIRAIERKSGGWPALAQIMIASRFGATLQGRDGAEAVGEFLRERLLAPLHANDRDIFARLSSLDRFSPSLVAQLITDLPTSGALARLIEQRLVSRVPSDEGLDLAVHPAFADLARTAFEASDPDAARQMRAHAAQACLAARKFVHATAMAVAVADEELIGEIMEACNPFRLWFELGISTLGRIIDMLPIDLVRSNPRIGYACITYWSKMGRLKACSDLFADIERHLQANGPIHALPPALRIERTMCRNLLAIYQGTRLEMSDVEELERLAPALPDLEPLIRSAAGTTRCYVLQLESAFDAARDAAREAIGQAEHADSRYAAFYLHCDLAMIAGIKGDVAAAWSSFQEGDRACQAALRDDKRLTMIRDAFRLELQHEIDPLDNAPSARLRNLCRRLPGLDGWPDVFAAVFRTYSEKLVLSGDARAALALLDAGIDYAERQAVRPLAYILEHHRVLLLILANEADEARSAYDVLARQPSPHPGLRPWRAREAMVEARAALAFRFGDPDVPALLDEAIDWAGRHGNVRSELRFRSLRSGLGTAPDSGDPTARLLRQSGFRRSAQIVERLLRRHEGTLGESGRPAEAAVSTFFTPRQMAVLEGVKRGLSDKALALELGITPHGVRYHLKRVYAQLGVHNREDASRKAPESLIIG